MCCVCGVGIFLFCSVLFRSLCQCGQTCKYPRVVHCTGIKINPNPARAEQNTPSPVDRGARLRWKYLFRREGFLSLSLPPSSERSPRRCQDSDTHLLFIWSCQSIFAHLNKNRFEKNLGAKTFQMDPCKKNTLTNPPLPSPSPVLLLWGLLCYQSSMVGNVLWDGYADWTILSFPFFFFCLPIVSRSKPVSETMISIRVCACKY